MSSLEKALRILDQLSKDRPVLRVGELCRELNIPKSSVSRLLKTMADHGLLEREQKDMGYVSGHRGLVLADLYLARHTLLDLVELALDSLIAEFGFVGYISVPDDGHVIIIRRRMGSYPLRMVREVGQRMLAWSTAIGRAHLARMPDDDALALIDACGPEPVDPAEARAVLAAIRRTGVASTNSLILPGIAAIGALVRDAARGETMGVSISYPTSAVDPALAARMAQRVREEAAAIGARVGDPFWLRGEPARGGAPTGEERGRGNARSRKGTVLAAEAGGPPGAKKTPGRGNDE